MTDSGTHRYPWKWNLGDLKPPSEDAPIVFSTFACGGGSSMGYKRAGFRVVGNCEIDPKIAAVYKENLHPEMSYVMDIREFNTLDDLPETLYDLDVLDGSPPCSTFSQAGIRDKAWGIKKKFAEGQKEQRLDDLFFTFLDTVEKLNPKVFVAENVMGLVQGKARGYVREIIQHAREIGYEIQIFKLNAAFMGVPQVRERVFFIGNRMGYGKLKLDFNESPVTFGEVRSPSSDLAPCKSHAALISKWRPGDRDLGSISQRINGKDKCYGIRINYDGQPVSTITASERDIRACDRMYMTDADIINSSSFPQDYDFCGRNVPFICGMSVPPSMMANVAHEIKAQWLDKE